MLYVNVILLARAALTVLRVDCLVLVSVMMFQCVCQYSECVYGGGGGEGGAYFR